MSTSVRLRTRSLPFRCRGSGDGDADVTRTAEIIARPQSDTGAAGDLDTPFSGADLREWIEIFSP